MSNCRCGNKLDSKGYCHECQQYDTSHEKKDFFEKRCVICNKLFTDLSFYMDHLETHPQCDFCKERFISKEKLNDHYDSDHKCPLCNEYYRYLSEHIYYTHPYCDVCNKNFLNNDIYEEHMKKHPQCTYCDKKFKDDSALYIHVQETHKCHVCLKYFTDVSDHLNSNHSFCRLCNRYFIDEKRYTQHIELEHTHKCMYCNTFFNFKEELDTHLKNTHKCKACKDYYTDLRQHFIDNHFYCEICRKPFFTIQDYNFDKKMHEHVGKIMQQIEKENKEMLARAFPDGFPNKKKKNTKKIECPFCSKTFLYEEARDRHIKEMHSHEKTKSSKTVKKSNKYKCPFCERKFKTEEGKSQHITAVHPNKL